MEKAIREQKDETLETQLWKAADKLRKNIDAAEFKHVLLDLDDVLMASDDVRAGCIFKALADFSASGDAIAIVELKRT